MLKDLKELHLSNNEIKELAGIENIRSNKLEKINLSTNLLTKLVKLTTFVALK